jgi:4-diphosphocytidyl-2-C-methyl-D-erythritol kinase
MNEITMAAPAKLNLSLDVTGLREDGYHTLDMVMQTVSVYEKVTIKKNSGGINISANTKYIPTDGKNTAVAAAQKFFEYVNIKGGADIYIRKSVPIKAGMAGGSADAAGVLTGLNILYETKLTDKELCEIGSHVGSDVPFMIVGGTRRVQGVGDIIAPAVNMPRCAFVICMPQKGMSTPVVFRNFNELKHRQFVDTEGLLGAIKDKDLNKIANLMENVLEKAADGPYTAKIKNDLKKFGALGSVMTGSGAAVFGLFDDEKKAKGAYLNLKGKYRSVYLAHPIAHGPRPQSERMSRRINKKFRRF